MGRLTLQGKQADPCQCFFSYTQVLQNQMLFCDKLSFFQHSCFFLSSRDFLMQNCFYKARWVRNPATSLGWVTRNPLKFENNPMPEINGEIKLQPSCILNNDHQNPRRPFLGWNICSKVSAVNIFLPKSLWDQNLTQPYVLKNLLQEWLFL